MRETTDNPFASPQHDAAAVKPVCSFCGSAERDRPLFVGRIPEALICPHCARVAAEQFEKINVRGHALAATFAAFFGLVVIAIYLLDATGVYGAFSEDFLRILWVSLSGVAIGYALAAWWLWRRLSRLRSKPMD